MKNIQLRPPRFVASLLALTSFGSYNKRVCGSLRSPKSSYRATSDTRRTLGETAIDNGENEHD